MHTIVSIIKNLGICSLVWVTGALAAAPEPPKNILILGDQNVEVRDVANLKVNAKITLPQFSILEIKKEEFVNQYRWYYVVYTNLERSSVRDTTGYIEVAPDLKDIVPMKVLQNAFLYFSIDPPNKYKIDLLEAKWAYTNDVYEQKLSAANAEDEVVKEWYKVRCTIFLPAFEEGYVPTDKMYYRAFTRDDAERRIKAVKAHPEWENVYKEKILGGFISEHMSMNMVKASWGEPQKIEYGAPQLWIYGTEADPTRVKFSRDQVIEWDKK
jgi:hypothetical protein